MNTTSIGQAAETAATEYLIGKGYKLVDRNWRTQWCEIDIVVQRDKCIYFVEVKYRRQSMQGSGLDYVTRAKVNQMSQAAEMWVATHKWVDDYSLGAIEVSGPEWQITGFVVGLLL